MTTKALLLQTDVDIVTKLLEDESAYGAKPGDFARKILNALYANDSEKSLTAIRGSIVVHAGYGVMFTVGPYATLDAARLAVTSPNFGEVKWLYPARMVHPHRYQG